MSTARSRQSSTPPGGRQAARASSAAAAAGERGVIGDDGVERVTRIVRRGRLGDPVAGPAVIEEADSTTFVPEGWTAADAAEGCLVLEPA